MQVVNENDRDNVLETAQSEFLRALEESDNNEMKPNLPELARQYPEVALELTEWATNLVARRQILAADTESSVVSELTERIVSEAKAALRARPNTLYDAVKALNLSQFKLAERLRLAPSVTSELCNGTVREWPARLEAVIADALLIPVSRVNQLLMQSRPVAGNYSAEGDPNEGSFGTIIFREAIKDALEEGEISPENAQFWLNELDSEGK